MDPSDLPIVVLPLELSDDSAAILIEFLQELTDALERHYTGQLLRRRQSRSPNCALPNLADDPPDSDPPF
jgi:hypothetical protein